jgi:hypothetical protein
MPEPAAPAATPAAPSPSPAPSSPPPPASAAPSPSPSPAPSPPSSPPADSPPSRQSIVDNYAAARQAADRPAEPPPQPASGKVTIGGTAYDEAVITDALAAKAAADSRALTLPKTAEEYTPTLPETFKPPPGVEYALNPSDPAFIAAREFALEAGLTTAQWQKMLSVYAGSQIGELTTVKAARDAEVAKLGPTAKARLIAIEQFYKATYGAADARIKMARLLTADDVRIAELDMARAVNPGGTTFAPSREAPPDAGRVSEEQYSRMSAGERLDYARNFPQPTNGARRR